MLNQGVSWQKPIPRGQNIGPHRPLSLGQKRGGLRAEATSQPPRPAPDLPTGLPVQGQLWPQCHPACAGVTPPSQPPPVDPFSPLGLAPGGTNPSSLLTHLFLSLFTFFLPSSFSSILSWHIFAHTHSSQQHRYVGLVTARACSPYTRSPVYTCHLFGAHVLSRPLSARSCSVSLLVAHVGRSPRSHLALQGQTQPRTTAQVSAHRHLQGQHLGRPSLSVPWEQE